MEYFVKHTLLKNLFYLCCSTRTSKFQSKF